MKKIETNKKVHGWKISLRNFSRMIEKAGIVG